MEGNVEQVKRLLEWLEQESTKPDQLHLQPTVVSYNCLIHALAKCQTPESAREAQTLLERMESGISNGFTLRNGSDKVRRNVGPNFVTYTSVIKAWAYSTHPSPAEPAFEVFQKLVRAYDQTMNNEFKPDIFPYIAVLQACAKEHENKPRALDIARQVFEMLRQSIPPNELAFCSIMYVGNQLLSSDMEEWKRFVQPFFFQCCQAGYVSRGVLAIIRRGSENFSSSIEPIVGITNTNSLPREWSRNVPKNNRP